MLTPRLAVMTLRALFLTAVVGVGVLMLGPYQGLEQTFGLTDKPAHAITAFLFTLALFAIAPRWRRLDLALVVLLAGALLEFGQGLTGRSMSLSDLLADALGVAVALMPGMIEQLRYHVRRSPDVAFGTLRRADRRRPRRSRPSVAGRPPSGVRAAAGR